MLNARQKGASGEREFAEWLAKLLHLNDKPTRNLEQTRNGGGDIVDVPGFVFEVKRCEQLNLPVWWRQVFAAAHKTGRIPVVAYRKNRHPWEFLVPAKYIGIDTHGYAVLQECDAKLFIKKHYIELYKTI